MYVRFSSPAVLLPAVLLLALSGLAGCSGGGTTIASTSTDCSGTDARVICLTNCNLGCSRTGCARTDIAQNEIIVLQFNEDIDPATVSTSTIRFRTASGDQPVGEYFVNGSQIEFVPTLRISGGQTYFGFAAGETYTMTIVGGEGQAGVVRGTSGKPFERTITCTLASTRGIQDLNQSAPRATLVRPTPAQLGAAPRDTDILIEFNELIDATPFLTGTDSPVKFSVRRTRATVGGGRECDPASVPQVLNGAQALSFDAGRSISILRFSPTQVLPGNVCVEIVVTDGVADLSGRSAQPQTIPFLTEVVPLADVPFTENFDNDENLDRDASAGTWAGGLATFAQIGGDGRHGSFDVALGEFQGIIPPGPTGKRTYRINTNSTIIPAANTTTGAGLLVDDGRFFFDQMVVPSDVRLRFIGSKAPVFTVMGRLDIQGEIDVQGETILVMPISSQNAGQAGGLAGIFGGAGGKGGDKCFGVGPAAVFNGSAGTDGRLEAGHAYFNSFVGTGGRGSTLFPANGITALPLSQFYFGTPVSLAACVSAGAGGGGGGFLVPGLEGRVITNNHPDPGLTNVTSTAAGTDTITVASASWLVNRYVGRSVTINTGVGAGQVRTIAGNTADTITVTAVWTTNPTSSTFTVAPGLAPNVDVMGPSAPGGTALQLFPYPAPGTQQSSLHFLVGGAGGGGSASHPALCLFAARSWATGAGGGGGGGAIGFRAGDSLRLAPTGRILANGGSAANSPTGVASGPQVAPAGGGSGGSIVLQSGRLTDLVGLLNVSGGLGGTFNRSSSPVLPPQGANVQITGGNGAPGFVRFEAPGSPTPAQLTNMLPAPTAANVATLAETDRLVGCRSNFYSTNLIFGPEFVRYEIHALVNGVPTIFSDDLTVSTVPALPGSAVRVLFQAATLDLVTGVPSDIRPWRTSVRSSTTQVGIASDGLNGFRFMLIIDRWVAPNVPIVVDKLVVLYRV